MNKKKMAGLAVLTMGLFSVAGCAAVPHRVDLLYQPVSSAKGGSGTVYLAAPGKECDRAQFPVRWVIGSIQDDSGQATEEIITPVSPGDLLHDAFRQELKSAGYTVSQDEKAVPADGRLLRLSNIKLDVSEVPGLFKITTTAKVAMTVEQWQSGRLVKKEMYQSDYTDTYARSDEQRMQAIVQKSLENITGRAVQDIVASGK